MLTPAGIVARAPVGPVALQPTSLQPLTSTGAAAVLASSTNSSFPPAGPRKRSSVVAAT
jgi:hypothetical protein